MHNGIIDVVSAAEALALPRDQIAALQLERLQSTVRHACGNDAHVRDVSGQRGVRPSGLVRLSDIAKFPFTTEADLRTRYPFGTSLTREAFPIIRGVNVFPTRIENLLLRCDGLAPHLEIEITRSRRMDEVTIFVERSLDRDDTTMSTTPPAGLARGSGRRSTSLRASVRSRRDRCGGRRARQSVYAICACGRWRRCN